MLYYYVDFFRDVDSVKHILRSEKPLQRKNSSKTFRICQAKLYNIVIYISKNSHEIALELGDILSLKLSLPGWLS